jgi:hypothetical protein
MLQAAGNLPFSPASEPRALAAFHLLLRAPQIKTFSVADLVHDNLRLHPIPNHLADAAIAQLLIGGEVGACA